MKIALYSPYVPDHFGGGEKHFFDVATALAAKHQVVVALPQSAKSSEQIAKQYEKFLGYSLSGLTWQTSPLYATGVIRKLLWTARFDYLYSFTDGSLFLSLARKNNLHFQVPLARPALGIFDRLKLKGWQLRNANSQFTKKLIESRWGILVPFVHYPCVRITTTPSLQAKKPIILGVGRFFRQLHSKRQDILIECFRTLTKQHANETRDWELVLVGTVEDESLVKELRQQAADLRVTFVLNASRAELDSWYQRASIYWHAAGYNVDEHTNPEMVEHFGITTVEAMANGAVPLVVYKGGQKEILSGELQQLGWQTIDECVSKTVEVIKDKEARRQLAASCLKRSEAFSQTAFVKTLQEMLGVQL